MILVAEGRDVVDAGIPLLPTLDHPHWTVVVSSTTPTQFDRVRRLFRGPIENPAWAGQTPPVR
jgi:hypothetical protein